MRTKTKIILGIVLFFPVYYGGAFAIATIWEAIDPEGQAEYFEAAEKEQEAEKIRLAKEEAIKNIPEWAIEKEKELVNQKMYSDIEHSLEKRYERLVLNYKGTDGKGFSIKDFANARCLKDQQGSSAQYMDDNFDDKSGYHSILVHTPVNINLNPPCLGGGWWFGVNNQGNVITWEYDGAADVLDYLDNQG